MTSWSDGLCLRVGVLFNLLPQGYPGDAREACCYRQFTQISILLESSRDPHDAVSGLGGGGTLGLERDF